MSLYARSGTASSSGNTAPGAGLFGSSYSGAGASAGAGSLFGTSAGGGGVGIGGSLFGESRDFTRGSEYDANFAAAAATPAPKARGSSVSSGGGRPGSIRTPDSPSHGSMDGSRFGGSPLGLASPRRHTEIQGPPVRSYDDDDDEDADTMETPLERSRRQEAPQQEFRSRSSAWRATAPTLPALTDDARDRSPWVTVFGYQQGMADSVLRYFQEVGKVINQRISQQNYFHIQYSTADEAMRALGRNGQLFQGDIMLGVIPCADPSIEMSNIKSDSAPRGHRRLDVVASLADIEPERIFKNRRRRRNLCSQICEYLFNISW